jgi:hypothetical protein
VRGVPALTHASCPVADSAIDSGWIAAAVDRTLAGAVDDTRS